MLGFVFQDVTRLNGQTIAREPGEVVVMEHGKLVRKSVPRLLMQQEFRDGVRQLA